MRGSCALGTHSQWFQPLQKLQENERLVLTQFVRSNAGLTCIDIINGLGSLEITDAVPMDVDSEADPQRAAANMLVSYAPFFSPEELMQPKLATRSEMESVLLDLRKRAGLDEYFGDEEMPAAKA